jgi:anti-sigma regulatory factor (Ser/Thr protein kinase)
MQVRKLTVFVASPGDTTAERNCLSEVVDELNRGTAADYGYVLELVKWETHAWPGLGADGQDVINREINVPDVLIVILWTRIGTPTGRAQSGTIEEFERAYDAARSGQPVELLVYFKETPYYPKKHDLDQFREVLDFRDRVQKLGILTWNFLTTEDFRNTVRQHLTKVLRRSTAPSNVRQFDSGKEPTTSQQLEKSQRNQKEYESLYDGNLEAAIETSDSAAVDRLMGVVGRALPNHGFQQRSVRAVQTAVWELLSNAAKYGNNHSIPIVRITIPPTSPKWVDIEVENMGPGFDLEDAIVASTKDIQNGRQHGLWRVKRLASELEVLQLSSGRCLIRFRFCETERPPSVFDDVRSKAAIMVEWEWPRIFWIGNSAYVNRGIIHDLAAALRGNMKPLLELYFGQLPKQFSYLCIESLGHTELSEGAPYSDETFAAAVERYFGEQFAGKRVIIMNSSRYFGQEFRAWKDKYGIAVFERAIHCKAYLRKIRAI